MKKFLKNWKGVFVDYFVEEELISFYAFFTIIFAECAYLWAFESKAVSIGLTIVLLAYIVNVLVFAWLKGCFECSVKEITISRLYIAGFIILFIIGCFINFWLNLVLIAIAFGITLLWVGIRCLQSTGFVGFKGIINIISAPFYNKPFWIISQIIVLGAPFAIFTWMLALIPGLSIVFKIIIPIAYFVIAPFMSMLEDELMAQNIFEIAYDIWYDEEYEKMMKQYNIKN